MKSLKKYIIVVSILIFTLFISTSSVNAAYCLCRVGTSESCVDETTCSGSGTCVSTCIPNVTGIANLGELIQKGSGLVTPFAVIGFMGSVIYAGFIRLFAAGDSEKEGKSMKIAISAAVGFAIIAFAPLIVRIVATFLNLDSNLVT